jgi:hypothetical protein
MCRGSVQIDARGSEVKGRRKKKRKGSSARNDKPPKEKRWKRRGKQVLEAQ